jgi:uncharacterized protein YggE
VADEDVQTRFVQLRPRYGEPGPGGEREVIGCTASNTVETHSPGPVGAGVVQKDVREVPIMPGSQTLEVDLRIKWQLTGQIGLTLEE